MAITPTETDETNSSGEVPFTVSALDQASLRWWMRSLYCFCPPSTSTIEEIANIVTTILQLGACHCSQIEETSGDNRGRNQESEDIQLSPVVFDKSEFNGVHGTTKENRQSPRLHPSHSTLTHQNPTVHDSPIAKPSLPPLALIFYLSEESGHLHHPVKNDKWISTNGAVSALIWGDVIISTHSSPPTDPAATSTGQICANERAETLLILPADYVRCALLFVTATQPISTILSPSPSTTPLLAREYLQSNYSN